MSREANRERWPEFAEWLDGMRETFGDVKVLYVKFPDGAEIKSKEYEREN